MDLFSKNPVFPMDSGLLYIKNIIGRKGYSMPLGLAGVFADRFGFQGACGLKLRSQPASVCRHSAVASL